MYLYNLIARGKTSPTSSGTIVAISELACKLQPYSPTPVITLEINDTYVERYFIDLLY